MEEKRSLILKVVLLVVAIAAILIIVIGLVFGKGGLNRDKMTHAEILDEDSEIEDEGEPVLMIPKEDVFEFSFTDSKGIILNFRRDEEGGWIYTDNEEIAINNDRIDKLLNYLCDIRYIDTIEPDDDGDLYGLTQDSVTCSITDYSGNKTIISFGNIDENKDIVYYALNYDYTCIYTNSGKLRKICEYGITDLIAP